jgi:sodium-dependent dicarboxylate transporter 2/3/5
MYRKSLSGIKIHEGFVHNELVKLGKTTRDEKIILGLIAFLFLGWLFKDDIDFGAFTLRGWTDYFPNPDAIKESTLMLLVCLVMYFIPSVATKKTLIDWGDFKRVPIGVIFLFGGGFALSKGIKESGLSGWITAKLEMVSDFPPFFFLIILVALVTLLSEFASNVATMNILMAVIFNVLNMVDLVPQQVLIATAMAASVGFALPAATPPNSIVYGTDLVPARQMIKAGLLLDVSAILIVSLFCYFLVGYMF